MKHEHNMFKAVGFARKKYLHASTIDLFISDSVVLAGCAAM